jgi:hypothetical protein
MFCVVLLFALLSFFTSVPLKIQCVYISYLPRPYPNLAWKVGILSIWGQVSFVSWYVYAILLLSLPPGCRGGGGLHESVGGSGGVEGWVLFLHDPYNPYTSSTYKIVLLSSLTYTRRVLFLQYIFFLGTYLYHPACNISTLIFSNFHLSVTIRISWTKDRCYLTTLS